MLAPGHRVNSCAAQAAQLSPRHKALHGYGLVGLRTFGPLLVILLSVCIVHGMGKFFRRRKFVRKSRFKRRRSGGRKRVFEKRVRRVIDKTAEKKYKDYNAILNGVGGNVAAFTGDPAQGTNEVQRVGDKIRIRAVKARANIYIPDGTGQCRLIIVAWRDGSTTPTEAAILEDFGVTVERSINSPYNRQNLHNKAFTPMYDRTWWGGVSSSAGPSTSGIGYRTHIKLNFYGKRLPHKNREYLAGTTNCQWKYYAIWIFESFAVSHESIGWTSRLTFTDV